MKGKDEDRDNSSLTDFLAVANADNRGNYLNAREDCH